MLEHGKNAAYFEQLADEAEGPEDIPAPLLSAPRLAAHTAPLLSAFLTLSSMRSAGFMVNPITASDALAYLAAIPICTPRRFLDVISRLDVIWLAHSQKTGKGK